MTILIIFLMTILVAEWVASIDKANIGRLVVNFSKIILFIEILKNLWQTPWQIKQTMVQYKCSKRGTEREENQKWNF